MQADLRAFTAHDVQGVCAVTAVTAQSADRVTRIYPIPPDVVVAQIRSVMSDASLDAVKTGMLTDAGIVSAVVDTLRQVDPAILVVDPVLLSSSGALLLEENAIETFVRTLLPLATCVTPNRQEAERITGRTITSLADAREAARSMRDLGPDAVVVTGGHLATDDVVDVVFDGADYVELRGPRIRPTASHGTGCSFSAALAAALAKGHTLADAGRLAKRYVADVLTAHS